MYSDMAGMNERSISQPRVEMRFSCIFHKIWEAYEILSYSWHSKLSKMVNKIRWDRWFRSYELKKKWTFFAHNFWLNHTLEKIETLHRSEFNFLSFSPYRNSLNCHIYIYGNSGLNTRDEVKSKARCHWNWPNSNSCQNNYSISIIKVPNLISIRYLRILFTPMIICFTFC